MSTKAEPSTERRIPLNRERVLHAAVDLADKGGIEAVSMRKVGQELGVEAMSLYNHVANKEDLLDGMVDVIVSEIDTSDDGSDWRSALRHRILSARSAMRRHPWAMSVIETRTTMSQPMISYMDDMLGIVVNGGMSYDLAHHAMHALGSRMLGFTQELFRDTDAVEESPEVAAIMAREMAEAYPNISTMLEHISHDEDSILGAGCDDDVEFAFGLDLILDGLERMRTAG